MQIKEYSSQKLPFSDLYQTYLNDFSQLEEFYEIDPRDITAIRTRADRISCSFDRDRVVELLTDFNRRFDVSEATLRNIRRFEDKQSLAIVTGQQLGVYGGPVFTAYKTITAIYLARKLEEKLERPVIPVFWLADEDHDYDEVNHITVLDGDEVSNVALPDLDKHRPPVSELVLPEALVAFKEKAREVMHLTDFTDQLWKILDQCFRPGVRFDVAFGNFIARLFSKYGLVLAGSNNAPIKQMSREQLKAAITSADQIRNALDAQSERIKKDFHQQVTLYDSNLFYLDDPGRVKIVRNGTSWKTDTGQEWTTQELLDHIERHPERFSPNVFMRPILQEKLLPTLGYVAGPGETAYYGQMKAMYGLFDMKMPVIFPRLSATIVEPAIDRIVNELPFEIHEYNDRIEDLETNFVKRTDQTDIEGFFKEWRSKVEELASPRKEKVKAVDPTLEAAAGKATAVYINELDKLKGKVYRSIKKQEQIQLDRIHRIKSQLFPAGGLQERNVAAVYFMNKYGVDFWDRILEQLEEKESFSFNDHKLIYI